MKRYVYFCLLMFLTPIIVNAEVCDDSLYQKKVAAAELIKLVYNYNPKTKKMDVQAINVKEEFSFKIEDKIIKANSKEVSLGSFPQGESILVNFYTLIDLGCGRNNLVTKRYVNLPFYNPFYNDERCIMREDLDACNYYYPIILDEKMFADMVYLYDEQTYNKILNVKPKKKVAPLEPWYLKNKYYLIIGSGTLMFILIGYITYRIKENKIEGEL